MCAPFNLVDALRFLRGKALASDGELYQACREAILALEKYQRAVIEDILSHPKETTRV